jgi:hypothetical protein
MDLEAITDRFDSFLRESWKLSDVAAFSRTYVRLLLLFKNELSREELSVVLERQKQLRGEEFSDEGFDELRTLSCRKMMPRDNNSTTRREALYRLLFCSLLLKIDEPDFYYLTEPMYECVEDLEVSPDELKQILESEFSGFRV